MAKDRVREIDAGARQHKKVGTPAKAVPKMAAKKAAGPIKMTRKARVGKTAEVLVLSPARGKRTLSHRQIEDAVRRVMSERSSADG
jgi:hypothetical protein